MNCEIGIIILNFIVPNFRNLFVSELIQIFHVMTTRSIKSYLSLLSIMFCFLMDIHGLTFNDNVFTADFC